MTTSDEEHLHDRRRLDAVATATAIESVRGDIKALSVELKAFATMVNHQVEGIQREQKTDRSYTRDMDVEITEKLTESRAAFLLQLSEHKHDTVPHPETLGVRVASLESSRTYMKGMIAVGALAMPAITGLVFKWLGV